MWHVAIGGPVPINVLKYEYWMYILYILNIARMRLNIYLMYNMDYRV